MKFYNIARNVKYMTAGLYLAAALGCTGVSREIEDPFELNVNKGIVTGRVSTADIVSKATGGEDKSTLRVIIFGDGKCGKIGSGYTMEWTKEQEVIEGLQENLYRGSCIRVPYKQIGETKIYGKPKIAGED